jgi:hypothetical protein
VKTYKTTEYIDKVFVASGTKAIWGGYYNYNFLSSDTTKLLSNRCGFDGRAIEKGDKVEIGYYDISSGDWHTIDESDSFNWPQGTMLQWLPNTNDSKVVFNLSRNGKLISRVVDITTGETRDLCYPVYCITPDGKYAITLNFERSYWTPAYHYQSVENAGCDVDVLEGDGIFSLDIEHNILQRIIAIEDVLKTKPEPMFSEGKHWLEHIMISPSGTRFVFLHRYMYPHTGRLTRIIIADIDGSNMQVVDGWRKFAWSHFAWQADDSFVIYARESTNLARAYSDIELKRRSINAKACLLSILKKVYRIVVAPLIPENIKRIIIGHNGYQLYQANNGFFKYKETYGGILFAIDGHPSFAGYGKYMITDTYPDEKKYRYLIVWNTQTHKGMRIGKFYSPFYGTAAACDLHPKLAKNGKYIVVDTACTGKRNMMVFRINWAKVVKKLG